MRKGSITAGLAAGIFGMSSMLGAGAPLAQSEPKYGGTLEIGTVYVTLSALSFDPADWNWKLNHDTGNYLEQLFADGAIGQAQPELAIAQVGCPQPRIDPVGLLRGRDEGDAFGGDRCAQFGEDQG